MSVIRLVSCKIGTIPAMVQVWRNATPVVGAKLKVRLAGKYEWIFVTVDKVNPDGYFFASR